MKYIVYFVIVLVVYLLSDIQTSFATCPRDRSRIVRRIFQTEIKVKFDSYAVEIPYTCPLSEQRDMYNLQERNKYEETPHKFVCQICGKAFYEEQFLDLHFENRHDDYMKKGRDATCLSDYCDIFRCDVLTKVVKPRFWDVALCREETHALLQQKCLETMKLCLPGGLGSRQQELYAALNQTLCSYLTCERYWELLTPESSAAGMALFMLFSMFLIIGVLVYYYLAYAHFYTDNSLLDSMKSDMDDEQDNYFPRHTTNNYHIRQRTAIPRR